jgi:prepilin-type N-terminal cleavage/methylation domain-containing protein/prepilin-type processing-associated H-X9-DG protein
MPHPRLIQSSPPKDGNFGDSARRRGLARDGFASGAKAARRAFTLIELLVVIAIIAILAAMLLPALSQAKMKGQMISDLNNFKQLQLCWHMYTTDNNDFLPPNFVSNGNSASNSWVVGDAQTDTSTVNIQNGILYQYNQQAKIYVCPANTKMITVPPSLPLHPTSYQIPITRTCSIDLSLGGDFPSSVTGPFTIGYGGNPTFRSYQKLLQIQPTKLSAKIVFCDESYATVDDGAFGLYPLESPQVKIWWNMPGNRHSRGTVWSFADGHCEYWQWHGSVVNNPLYQTTYEQENITADASDDLSRAQAGGAQYP